MLGWSGDFHLLSQSSGVLGIAWRVDAWFELHTESNGRQQDKVSGLLSSSMYFRAEETFPWSPILIAFLQRFNEQRRSIFIVQVCQGSYKEGQEGQRYPNAKALFCRLRLNEYFWGYFRQRFAFTSHMRLLKQPSFKGHVWFSHRPRCQVWKCNLSQI